ncbi:MAG: hypothetical protein JOZ54_12215, partial [Acidobacteria bacterium]|nr:hypothetical protein [Acidobacteriota bacterium]
MNLGIAPYSWHDLHNPHRLRDLAGTFDRFVERNDASLYARFDAYRSAMQSGTAHGGLSTPDEAALLIAVATEVGSF